MSEHRNGHQEHRGLSEMIPDSRGEPIRPVDSVRWPEPPARPVLDDAILAAITQSVRELLFCANVGELLHGFSLYSASHLFRFMDETGLSEEEFHEVYGAVPPKSPEAWTRLAGLWEIERLSDGRIEATATYRDVRGEPVNGAERYRFALSPDGMFWAIDDIRPVEGPEA